jgi:hypothetical protein
MIWVTSNTQEMASTTATLRSDECKWECAWEEFGYGGTYKVRRK